MVVARIETTDELELALEAIQKNQCEVSRFEAIRESSYHVVMIEYEPSARNVLLSLVTAPDISTLSFDWPQA